MASSIVRNIFIASLSLIAATAHASQTTPSSLPPLPESLYYRISFGGIPLGRIRFSASETESRYQLVVDTKSKGMASVFSPFRTIAQAEGTKQQGHYAPTRYTTTAEKSDEGENHTTTLLYAPDGSITSRTLTHPDDPSWRPLVPATKINKAPDAVTGFARLRSSLFQAQQQGISTVSERTYDGKRLANIHARIITTKKHPRWLATRVTRTPIDGYTPKEWKKFKKGDPELLVWWSHEKAFMPARLELSLLLGTVVIYEDKE